VRLAHVLVEQFRPGVMARLGLGPDEVRAVNPDLVYCSIGGFSPHGPKAGMAGHDLMYLADSGLLSLVADGDGRPTMPHALIADIAAGAYPAVINILLGLLSRPRGGRFHVTMADNVSPFLFWAVAAGRSGAWPRPGAELFTGGSPRYQIYETADGRFLAAAPLEPRFWQAFCDAIGLDPLLRDDRVDPKATRDAVAALVRRRSADQWMREFSGRDACCTVVRTVEEASGALAAGVVGAPPEASTPLDPAFLAGVLPRAPALGEANAGMESLWTD
jgi:crotonobetainyl-CoA:carnitine CoA-transferase CaiB-like acyl-CoA transferase